MVCMEMDMENGLPVILCFYAVAKFFFIFSVFIFGLDSEVVYLLCLIFYFCVFLVCKRAYTVRCTPFLKKF